MSDTIVVTTEVPVTVEVSGPQGPQGAAGTVTYGTTAATACEGNDARISGLTNGGLTTGATLEVNNVAGISVPDFNFSINAEENEISSSNTLFFDQGINTQGVSTTSLLASGQTTIAGSTTLANSINLRNTEDTGVIEANFIKAQEFEVDSGGQLSFLSGSGTGIVASTTTAFKSITLPNATGTVALTQQATDIEITDPTKGYILNSATKRWRITIDDNGVLLRTALALIFSLSFMCGSHAQVRDLVYGTNNVVVGPTNTNALTFTNLVTLPIASGAATTNSLLTADGAGGSAFVANRMTVSGLTTNVVRTNWVNVGADKATNDTGLSLSYAANNVYKLRWQLLVGSTWSNFAYGLSFSSTNTYTVRVIHTTLNSSQPTGISLGIGATNYTLATETGNASTIMVWGETVWMPTNAGTVNMRFWTSSSNANTSTLFSNSFITLEKLYP